MNALHRTWAVLALALAGCGEKPTVVAEDAGAAANQPKTILGGKLGAAAAAVEASAKAPPSSSAAANGPPETGVFTPAAADAALPTGAPAKIELLGEGSEPRVLLSMAPKGDEQKAVLTVSAQVAQVAMALDFGLTFKLDKPKGDKSDKSESAAPVKVVAAVSSIAAPKELQGQLPQDKLDAFGKLKGSEIRYQVSPSGVISDLSTTMSKDVDKSAPVFPVVDLLLRSAGDALLLLSVVVPSKPVGVGGYWIVTERVAAFPVDVLRYRVFKVAKIDKDHASFTVDVRQYATSSDPDLGSLAKGEKFHIDVFESQGKARSEWVAGALLSPGGEAGLSTQAATGGGKGGQPKALLRAELGAKSHQADKSDKKK